MQIMMFTGDSPDKILLGDKTMTARHWRRTPPPVGSLFRAQRGRKKSTAFAICEVVDVRRWNGTHITSAGHDYIPFNIATCEGFRGDARIVDFLEAYRSLNAHHWDDPKRSHYFIEFNVREVL